MNTTNYLTARAEYSSQKLRKLRNKLSRAPELRAVPGLTVFCAGSYGRREASRFSDLDLFFLRPGEKSQILDPHTKSLRIWGKVIDVADQMNFPKFSNDCAYLTLLHTKDIVTHLGGPIDDHANYFTARMLLLLESECLYGDESFIAVKKRIVRSYFKDYPDHKSNFQPIFLLNDICRYWKTLLLNYENRRDIKDDDAERKKRHRVRNFKLKFSRMTTCFASIAALGSRRTPVTQGHVIRLTELTPRERLESVCDEIPALKPRVENILDQYAWFIRMTGLSTPKLESHFSNERSRSRMFRRANEYGASMFDLLKAIDSANMRFNLLRNLVI